ERSSRCTCNRTPPSTLAPNEAVDPSGGIIIVHRVAIARDLSLASPPREPDVGETGEYGRRSLTPAPQQRHTGGEVDAGLDCTGKHGEPAEDDDQIDVTDNVAREVEMKNAEHAVHRGERTRQIFAQR